MNERRRSPRRPAAELPWGAARLRPGRDVALLNLGEGGALVEAGTRLLPGAKVVLQLLRPGGVLAIRGRVERCEVTALDPARGVRYQGAVSFEEQHNLLGEVLTRCG